MVGNDERLRDLMLQLAGLRHLWDRLAKQRGEYLTEVIKMEEALDDLITDCLGVDHDRRELFAGVLLANVGLAAKTRALRILLEADEVGFKTQAVKKLHSRLEETREFRNLCAHVPPVGKDDHHGERVLHFVTYSQSGKEKIVQVDAESMAARIAEAVDLADELRGLRAVRRRALEQVSGD